MSEIKDSNEGKNGMNISKGDVTIVFAADDQATAAIEAAEKRLGELGSHTESTLGKKRNRFSDFLIKCVIRFALLAMVLGILLVSLLHFTETSDRRVMYKLLNYSRETIIEGKVRYFRLPDVPEFKIYPINENEFTVVFTNGKTVSSKKNIVIAGAGDNALQTGFIDKQKAIK